MVSTAPVPPSATAQTASSVPPGEGAPPRCNPVNVWDASTSGTGIAVALMYQPAPGPITVTVREKSGKTDNQSRTLAPGEDSPQFDFPAVSKDSVESVFVQTSPASRCVVSAFGSG